MYNRNLIANFWLNVPCRNWQFFYWVADCLWGRHHPPPISILYQKYKLVNIITITINIFSHPYEMIKCKNPINKTYRLFNCTIFLTI